MAQTAAQEEFQQLVEKNNREAEGDDRHLHPEDRREARREKEAAASDPDDDDRDEEDQYRAKQIDAAMRVAPRKGTSGLKLPPASFDSGCATGVKGVIADARSYETARKESKRNRVQTARRGMFGFGQARAELTEDDDDDDDDDDEDDDGERDPKNEESFLAQWRESRRRQLEDAARAGAAVRTRRTSPSMRIYGRLDTVDALGYLDAIEKVGRETVVVVFVYDDECEVSGAVEAALRPLVAAHPTVHFVMVHYEEIEFDNAAVPAILAYRNQGDLFANLTGLIEMLPADDTEDFSSATLRKLLQSQRVL